MKPETITYLVTGGTGFVGRRLVSRLAEDGFTVHVLSRDPAKSSLFTQPEVRFFTGDILDPHALEKAMTGCSRIYHLAAYARGWATSKKIYFDLNVTGTENVLKTAEKLGITKIVYSSTAGVINPSSKDPATENTPRTVPFFTSYEVSKHQAEQIIQQFVNKGMNIVIVNPSRIFGPGPLEDNNAVTGIILKYKQKKWHYLPGNGKHYGNYVYVDDVVNGMIQAMEKGKSGERYILGGENITYIRFFQEISKATGVKNFLIPVPLFFILSISRLILWMARIFHFHPLITPPWVKKYFYDWKLSSQKAIKELGYQCMTFPEALQKTVQFLEKTHE